MTDGPKLRGLLRAEQLGVRPLADLVRGSRAAIIVLDDCRRVLYGNDAACRLLASSLSRLQGCDLLQRFAQDERSSLSQHLDPLLLGSLAGFTGVVRGEDGVAREVFGRSVTVYNQGRPIVVLTMCDESAAHLASRAVTAVAHSAVQLDDAADLVELINRVSAHAVRGTGAVWCGFYVEDDYRRSLDGSAGRQGDIARGPGDDAPDHEPDVPDWDVMAAKVRAATGGAILLGGSPGAPVVLPDARSLWAASPLIRDWAAGLTKEVWRSGVCIPLAWQGRVIGVCFLTLPPGVSKLSESEMAFVAALADQATLAVMRTRLALAARDTAALEERGRLARDLHDSITQALFSITMHARAANLAMIDADGDPDGAVANSLASLTELARGALAEMRALIFDLRPDALRDEGLVAALCMQAKALSARSGVVITVQPSGRHISIDPIVQRHLYHLVVEALRHIIDAAHATGIDLSIASEAGIVNVEIAVEEDVRDPIPRGAKSPDWSSLARGADAIGARLAVTSGADAASVLTITASAFTGSD